LSQITQGIQKQCHFEVYVKCNRALEAYGETNDDWLCICNMAKCHTQVEDITMAFETFLSLRLPHLICVHSVNSLYGQIKGIAYMLIRVCSIWYLHGTVQLIRDAVIHGISLWDYLPYVASCFSDCTVTPCPMQLWLFEVHSTVFFDR
jgi:hypothetical protein